MPPEESGMRPPVDYVVGSTVEFDVVMPYECKNRQKWEDNFEAVVKNVTCLTDNLWTGNDSWPTCITSTYLAVTLNKKCAMKHTNTNHVPLCFFTQPNTAMHLNPFPQARE